MTAAVFMAAAYILFVLFFERLINSCLFCRYNCPDGLIDESEVSKYEVYNSPTRSAIFDAGNTSRINVGHFIAELITDSDTWLKWKGQMPLI